MFVFEFCIHKYILCIIVNDISSHLFVNEFMAFLIRLPCISSYATQKLAFLGIVPCSEGKRKTLSCSFHPKSEFGTEFKLRQMVPCLLARKERMMQRCAAIMKERTLKSMSSRWCHLYPSNSCPNSLPPTCEKAAELDTGSVLVRKGGCGSSSRTKSDLEEGIITISASGSLSLCETTVGSPSTNPALIPSSSQMWEWTPVC